MYRNSSRFYIALILGALVLVMTFLSGCVTRTLVAKPTPTMPLLSTPAPPKPTATPPSSESIGAPATSDSCGGRYEIGELLHPEGMELEIALTYVREHYPEQQVPVTWQLKKGKLPGPREYEATEGWALSDVYPTVRITNTVTGFHWEGAVHIERAEGKRRCWLEEVLIIREISVAVPSPAPIHVPTRLVTPTSGH